MFGYLEGLVPGKELDEALKKYKKAVKSHRRIGLNEWTFCDHAPIIASVFQHTMTFGKK